MLKRIPFICSEHKHMPFPGFYTYCKTNIMEITPMPISWKNNQEISCCLHRRNSITTPTWIPCHCNKDFDFRGGCQEKLFRGYIIYSIIFEVIQRYTYYCLHSDVCSSQFLTRKTFLQLYLLSTSLCIHRFFHHLIVGDSRPEFDSGLAFSAVTEVK